MKRVDDGLHGLHRAREKMLDYTDYTSSVCGLRGTRTAGRMTTTPTSFEGVLPGILHGSLELRRAPLLRLLIFQTHMHTANGSEVAAV